jgi:hypothetical protein
MQKLILSLVLIFSGVVLKAQEVTSVPDQNPNFKKSADKYSKKQEKTLEAMNTTEQKTYKAYDWSENKAEKKQSRVDFRRKKQLARINNICHVAGCRNMDRYHTHPSNYHH